jgi:DNA-binding NarL/FixJ family response regulator
MTSHRIRVVIVDDHDLYADSLSRLLRDVADIEVLGREASASAALRLIEERRPDVALVDYRLPDRDGIATAALLRTAVPDLRVIILTGVAGTGLVGQALATGCSGFLTKDRSADELVAAIRLVYAGQTFVSPTLATGRSADRTADPSLGLEDTEDPPGHEDTPDQS